MIFTLARLVAHAVALFLIYRVLQAAHGLPANAVTVGRAVVLIVVIALMDAFVQAAIGQHARPRRMFAAAELPAPPTPPVPVARPAPARVPDYTAAVLGIVNRYIEAWDRPPSAPATPATAPVFAAAEPATTPAPVLTDVVRALTTAGFPRKRVQAVVAELAGRKAEGLDTLIRAALRRLAGTP